MCASTLGTVKLARVLLQTYDSQCQVSAPLGSQVSVHSVRFANPLFVAIFGALINGNVEIRTILMDKGGIPGYSFCALNYEE